MKDTIDTPLVSLDKLHVQAMESLQEEMSAATALASAEIQQAVPLLARALSPAMSALERDLLLSVIAQLNEAGIVSGLYVKSTSEGEQLAIEEPPVPVSDSDDGDAVRITLRLPENIRDAIAADIADSSVSLNSWLVAAAREKLARQRRPHSQRRVSGWVI